MVSSNHEFLGDLHDEHILTSTLVKVYNFLREYLPDGCPMIIGGGFVRDGLLGGEPGDIDVWVPSNAPITANHFNQSWMREVNQVFELRSNTPRAPMPTNPDDYRDLNNLFVLEFKTNGLRVNIIKSMTSWENPAQFFRQMFKNFDFELCMFFIGLTKGNNEEARTYSDFDEVCRKKVIFPRSILDVTQSGSPETTIAINPLRTSITSQERMNNRYSKMENRYQVVRSNDCFQMSETSGDFEPQCISIKYFVDNILEYLPFPRIQDGN